MRLLITAAAILLFTALVVSGQSQRMFVPFDRWFGKTSIDDENIHLDNFAIALEHEPKLIGLIFVYVGKTSCVGEAQRRANRMKRYLVTVRGISRIRIIARNTGFLSEPTVVLQPVTRREVRGFFPYSPRWKAHVVKRCASSPRTTHNKSLQVSAG